MARQVVRKKCLDSPKAILRAAGDECGWEVGVTDESSRVSRWDPTFARGTSNRVPSPAPGSDLHEVNSEVEMSA